MTEVTELQARQEALEAANETLHEAFCTVRSDTRIAIILAKQNIKLMTTLRATQLEHGEAIAGLVTELADLKDGLAEVLRRLPA